MPLLILALAQSVATAADLETRIEAVTVCPAGAIVTRVASANLVAGENEIRLVGLVNSIEPDYLQVEIADSGVRIGQIQLGTEQQREAFNAEVASIVSQNEALTARIKEIDDSTSAAQLRLKFLDGLAQGKVIAPRVLKDLRIALKRE